jgi:tetratricopeptide (TPR) repeat protein
MRGNAIAALAALWLAAAAATPAAADCTLQKYGDLPIQMIDFRPVVQASINGQPVRLFIDTGSFWGTLSPATAHRLGLQVRYADYAVPVRGATGISQAGVTHVTDFALADVYRTTSVDFLVAEHELGVDGIVGQNLMGGADVEYDLANGVARLFQPHGCEHANLAYWAPSGAETMAIDPIQLPQNAIRGTAVLNGVKIKVMFDTGAPRSVLTLRAARRAGIQVDGPGVTSLGESGGVGSHLTHDWLAPFKTFQIGDEQITGTRLRIADVDLGDVDMLVGADFFLSHRIYVAKSRNELFLTYNGGAVFDLERTAAAPSAPAPAAAPASATPPAIAEADDTPHDAAGFVRRADAAMTREEFAGAIADYTRAIALTPGDAALYADRGIAYARAGQAAQAAADFDRTIQMHPQAPRALVGRGELRLAGHDTAGAEADFDAALKITNDVAPVIGEAYLQAGLYERAVATYDAALAGKPIDEDQAPALFARCQARALWGQELDQALADCSRAMRLRPGGTGYLQVRGLIYLRQGKADLAIADYDAALKQDPRDAWALYGRGRAELARGDKAKGDADIAAALAVDPRLTDKLKALGLS